MNNSFLLPPPGRLNQPVDGETEGGGGAMSSMTRRKFLKRSGGATVATLVAWNLASTQANAQIEENGGSSGSEYFLICTKAPSLFLNQAYSQITNADKMHMPDGTSAWLTHTVESHGTELTMMLLGVSKGWVGKSAQCQISAVAETAGQLAMGATEWIGAKNVVSLDESGPTPTIVWTPVDDADVDVETVNGRWVNVYVRIATGVVISIYSEWEEEVVNNPSPENDYKWNGVQNIYPLEGLSWEFKIIKK